MKEIIFIDEETLTSEELDEIYHGKEDDADGKTAE